MKVTLYSGKCRGLNQIKVEDALAACAGERRVAVKTIASSGEENAVESLRYYLDLLSKNLNTRLFKHFAM